MDAATKKKLTLALSILAVAVALAMGIFRSTGCEKGEAITGQVGDAIDNVTNTVPGLAPDAGTGGAGGAPVPAAD